MRLLYEGKDIYPEISIAACWHDMYACDRVDTLILHLNDTRSLWTAWDPHARDEIALEHGSASTGAMWLTSVHQQSGLVQLSASSRPGIADIRRSKGWRDVRLAQILQELAGRLSFTVQAFGLPEIFYTYIMQQNEDDLSFLQRVCRQEGLAFLLYDRRLVVYDEAWMEQQDAKVPYIELDPSADYSLNDHRSEEFGSCLITMGEYQGSFSAPGSKSQRVLIPEENVSVHSSAEAFRYAKGLLRNANKRSYRGSFKSEFKPALSAASLLNLHVIGERSHEQPAFIEHLRHDYAHNRSKVFFRAPLEGY